MLHRFIVTRYDNVGNTGWCRIQNGNHIETFQDVFPQLELIEPHAQRAFDLLVRQVENNVPLPPDQCVPRSGAIADSPAQAGHCASLFVP